MRISETLLIGNSLACQKENSKFFNPTGISLLAINGFSVLFFAVFSLKWIINRNFFPIRERSKWLTLITTLGFFSVAIAYPIAYFVILFEDPGVGGAPDDSLFKISFILAAARTIIFIPYFCRLLRVYLVFQTSYEGKFFLTLMRGEWFWMLALALLLCAIDLPIYFGHPFLNSINVFSFYYTNATGNENYFWVIYHFVEGAILLIFLYLLRDIPEEYKITSELTFVFFCNIIGVFCKISMDLMMANQDKISNYCSITIPCLLLVTMLAYLGMFFAIVARPALSPTPDHLRMAPLLVLQGDLSFVLKDEVCFSPFYKFAEYREKQESAIQFTGSNISALKKQIVFPQTLLHFVMQVELINRDVEERPNEPQPIRELVEEMVIKEQRPVFPQIIRQQLVNMYEEGELRRWDISELDSAYSYAYNTLNSLYLTEYKFTSSFNCLKRKLERYEEIYRRLNLFKMM